MKRLFKILAAIVVVLAVLAAIGWHFYTNAVREKLVPPPNPEGQASITQYVLDEVPVRRDEPELVAPFSWDNILTPPKSARAWTRWWWPGGAVDAESAIAQLTELDRVGFGGAEIQPFISGVVAFLDNEELMSRIYSFDSPGYYDTLGETLRAADDLGIQIDLTHFSGWPPGGPQVNLEDSLTIIAYGERRIQGGQRIDVELPKPEPGPSEFIFANMEFAGADFINFPASHARLVSVVAAKVVEGEHDSSAFNMDDTVTLDPASAQVLTAKVEGSSLIWDAPEGEWNLIASYLMPSGEVPMGAAQKPQGFVIDHLRVPQVIGHYEYAFGERTGLPKYYGKGFRGFFNDSLEFRLKRISVEGILDEFRKRRGYDLEPWLPAIYIEGVDNVYFREILGVHAAPEFKFSDDDERVRYDYQRTISDLVVERFIETSADWAETRGLISRAQSYGMDIDLLRALGSNTIPETEQLWAGGADIGLKFATSAAALYGRALVSAESFVWINRDYMPTARRIKAAADKMFLAGVNHIIYHGTPYEWWGTEPSPFGEEGWAPFSGPQNPANFSGNYGPNNTSLWPDVPDLNRYIARSQYLLRQGKPVVDVLVYYPFLGFHGPNPSESVEALVGGALPDADPVNVAHEAPMLTAGKKQLDRIMTVPHDAHDPRIGWVEKVQPLLRDLDSRGISWGWVNDHALTSGKVVDGKLTASGGEYQAVLLHDIERMPVATIKALQQQVRNGINVYIVGSQPAQQPGFANAEAGDLAVKKAVGELIAAGATAVDSSADNALDIFNQNIESDLLYVSESTIKRNRRSLGNTTIQFFANQRAEPASLKLTVQGVEQAWWFDALSGGVEPATFDRGQLELSLSGFESRFLVTGSKPPAALSASPEILDGADGKRTALTGWSFESGSFAASWSDLPDWRDVDELKHSKNGVYRHTLTLDEKQSGARYLLDLELIQGSANVAVNGKQIGRVSLPPFVIDLTDALSEGKNTIAITVDAPLRNHFVGKALAEDPRYSHMLQYGDALVAAGLRGKVELVVVD